MGAIQLVLAVLLCWWAPGFFLTGLLWPDEEQLPLLGRGLVSVALSVLVSSLAGLALVGVHQLSTAWAWGTMGIVTGVLAATWAGRRKARAGFIWNRRRTVSALFLLAALAVVLASRLYLAFGPHPIPLEPDSWAYLTDTERLIAMRSIPAVVVEWGLEITFPTSKLLFQLFCAVFWLLSGLDALGVMTWVTLLYTLVAAAALWSWSRQFLSRPLASALVMLAFHDGAIGYGILSNRFGEEFFRSEGFALMMGFIALWLAGRLWDGNGRRMWWLVALLLGAMALMHGVAALVMAVMVAALFAGQWAIERSVRWHEAGLLAKIAGLTMITAASLFFLVSGAPAPHFSSLLTGGEQYRQLGMRDPSYLLRLRLSGKDAGPYMDLRPKSAQRFYEPPERLLELLIRRSFPPAWMSGAGTVLILLFFLGAVLVCLSPAVPWPARTVAAALLALLAALYGIGLFFSWRYESFSLALHGANRGFPYGGWCVTVLLGLMAEGAQAAGRRVLRPAWRLLRAAYVPLLTALCLVLLVPGYRIVLTAYDSHGDLSMDGITALRWAAENTPKDAVLITNWRTAGSIELLAGRRALTEGRGVYLRPEILTSVFQVMDQVECFFHDPACAGVLNDYHVDYVVYAPARSIGNSYPHFSKGVQVSVLEDSPLLKRVAHFGAVRIYQVDRAWLEGNSARKAEVTQ